MIVLNTPPTGILRRARELRGTTQQQLADDAGCSRMTVHRVEKHGTKNRALAEDLARALELQMNPATIAAIMSGAQFTTWRVAPMVELGQLDPDPDS